MITDLAWLSDVHLNFLQAPGAVHGFGEYVSADLAGYKHPAVLITGDIAEYSSLQPLLLDFVHGLQTSRHIPLYFVLGNHDAYGGSIAGMRRIAQQIHSESACWLTEAGVVELTPHVALVGHDGWYDGQFGDPRGSQVQLNDFYQIEELTQSPRPALLRQLHRLGIQSARDLKPTLQQAAKRYSRVLVATHAPPFRDACWHDGAISDEQWLPWFTNKAMGMMLLDVSGDHQETAFEVFCGHTHSAGEYQALPNLRVSTAPAKYGAPAIHRVIDLE